MTSSFNNLIQLIRPKHYAKNLFIFLPLFFDGQITDIELLLKTLMAFFLFSMAASSIYILNDFKDIDTDKKHPIKKNRPLASGAVSKVTAILLMLLLMGLSISISAFFSPKLLLIIGTYMLLNVAYSYKLKHIALVDITIIAIGFVLRLFAGSLVTDVPLSKWIVIMTFLLALFLALAKRRDDVLLYLKTGKKMREVIGGYNLILIDGAMLIMSSVVIVSYILYTTSIEVYQRLHSDYLYISSLFVILGILRYLQIAVVENKSESPTKMLFKDTFIQITIFGWMLFFVWILYF